jgi:hypothetical protein
MRSIDPAVGAPPAHPEPGQRRVSVARRLPASLRALGGLLALACALAVGCRPPPPDDLDADGSADAGALADASADSDADAAAAAGDTGPIGLDLPPLDGNCTPGETRCAGLELDTCGPSGKGWIRSACFPGLACDGGACKAYANNLIIVFDTSGSMSSTVPGVACNQGAFPACAPADGCTRMDVSKVVFAQALAQLNPAQVSLALFRFPTRVFDVSPLSCDVGYQVGIGAMSGDTGAQSVADSTKWFWSYLPEVLAVAFPRGQAEALARPKEMLRWMDGVETLSASGQACGASGQGCIPSPICGGAGGCCAGQCHAFVDPELRATGGTPIGKTLFYVGEYLRSRVFVDGASCTVDADCGTPYHRCEAQRCVDPLRSCRETTVVMFTDGGQDNDPTEFFSPLPMAKRLAYGLGCKVDADCVGGAVCQQGRCLPADATGSRCLATGKPCLPGAAEGDPLHCPALPGVGVLCTADPVLDQVAAAKLPPDNVLRAKDGKPIGARLQVVDVSGANTIAASFALASAGGGRVLTADTADAASLLSALQLAFDLKNKKVCGNVN